MLIDRRTATPDTLDAEMEFDQIIYSHGDGTISDLRDASVRTPEAYIYEQWDGAWGDEGVNSPWTLLDGLTMHASEYIGGGLARYILEVPGFYVATAVYPVPLSLDDMDDEPDSWAVAYAETLADSED